MDRRKRSACAFVVGVFVLAVLPRGASGYFERLVVSSRVHSMGGAFVSVADDPGSVILNPAGLAQIRTASVLSTISRPYGLTDLNEYLLAAGLPTKFGSLGLSWHRFGLDGVTSEDLFTLAFARDLIRTSQDASLSVGAGVDIAHVSYSGEISGSETVFAGTLAVLLRPFPFIGAGYTVRNLGSPSFEWKWAGAEPANGTGAAGTELETTHAFGFAYHWEDKFSVLYERERGQDRVWRDHVGVEVNAGEHLRLRSGLTSGDVTGGIGVLWSNVTVDVGVASHDVLGLSYLVSVGISLPSEDEGKEQEW